MTVVIAIISIMTATIVGNQGSFRSATVATNMAYEVAATIRQAQLFGIGVRQAASGDDDLTDTYGVEFTAGSPTYSLFRERGTPDGECDGGGCNCGDPSGECVEQVRMLQQVQVEAICATANASLSSADLLASASACAQETLSATFTRPNPEATIRSLTPNAHSWNLVGILVRGGSHCRLVRLYENGQVSVEGISAADASGTQFSSVCDNA